MGRMMVGMNGGPGTRDPGQITFTNVDLRLLMQVAFDIKDFQLTAPDLGGGRFDISAKVPTGATKEDSHVMLQNLLAERFGLKVHHESKEMQAYALLVAKSGVKMKASANTPPPDGDAPPPGPGRGGPPKLDKSGFPAIPSGGRGMMMMMMNGQMRLAAGQQPMSQICDFLSNQLGRLVVDQTGLTGKYDFTLAFSAEGFGRGGPLPPPPPPPPGGEGGGRGMGEAGEPAPTLIAAIQDQLGLKIESKKLPVDIVVVDHIEKTPTEN